MLRQQLPNLVSAVRVVLTPFAVQAILAGRDMTAFWLCLVAGATDFLDGGLARWLGVQSRLGALLDPAADKFMLDVMGLAFWLARGEWAGLAIVVRDLGIVGGSAAIYALTGRKDFPPSPLGKASTVVQIAWVLILLGPSPELLRTAATAATIALTFLSGADYIRIGVNMLRAPAQRKN